MFGGSEGGFGGGGGFSTNFNSPGAGGDRGASKKIRSQRIIPCTISHIFSLENDGNSFKMGDLEVGQVYFVGVITNVQTSDTSVQYDITDHTTDVPITVRKWIINDSEDDDNNEPVKTLEPDTYVGVIGHIRSFQNKMGVTALGITPLDDRNEITTHMLECFKFQALKDKPQVQQPSNPSFGGFQADTSHSNAGGSGGGGNFNNGMDKIQSQVFQAVETCTEEQGMHVNEIQGKLKGLNKMQVRNALEFLSNEGHVYSTIDDDHFKSTS